MDITVEFETFAHKSVKHRPHVCLKSVAESSMLRRSCSVEARLSCTLATFLSRWRMRTSSAQKLITRRQSTDTRRGLGPHTE